MDTTWEELEAAPHSPREDDCWWERRGGWGEVKSQKIAGHRSVPCLISPTLAALLAEHDQGEAILKVFLEVTSIGLFAFHRCEKKRVDVGACWSRCKCLLSGLLVDEWYWLPLVVG